MAPAITITNSALTPSVVTIKATRVSVAGRKGLEAKPNANIDGPVDVQTQSFENPVYTISPVHFTGQANTLTYDHVLTLYRQKNTSSNATKLVVNYGTSGTLLNSLSQATGIKVVLDSFSLDLDTSDSKDAYMPTATLTFIETK